MAEKLTSDEREFLECLRDGRRLRLASRHVDRARQRMRRAGFAVVLKNPRRWTITPAGLAALKETHNG